MVLRGGALSVCFACNGERVFVLLWSGILLCVFVVRLGETFREKPMRLGVALVVLYIHGLVECPWGIFP